MTPKINQSSREPLRRVQRGVSIVELLIALTLGLVAVAGAASIYIANRTTFATVEGVARVEENARFAVELLARDIREAGNSVCGGAMISRNLISSPAVPNWATWESGLLGNAMAATGSMAISIASPSGRTAQLTSPATDSLLVWSASTGDAPVRITGHTPGASGTFTTATPHGYVNGDVVVACDGKQLVTFEVQSATGNSVGYSGGAAVTQFKPGALLSNMTARLWYVGGSEDKVSTNALRRFTIDKGGTKIANEEMVTGVSNLQIKYLVGDSSGTPKPAATYQIAAPAAPAVAPAWDSVIAVQLALTLESLDKIGAAGDAPSVFTHTVPLTVSIRRRLQP